MSIEKRAELVESLTKEVRKFIAGVILFNEKVAAALELNGTDLQFLNLLELRVASTPGELAKWSGLTTGGVTVVLDRLERAGFVRRQPNPADRRSILVQTVPARMRKLQTIYQSKSDHLNHAVADYNDRDLQVIVSFLERTNTPRQA